MKINKLRLYCPLAFVLAMPLVNYGQHTEYKDVFTPAGMSVAKAEKPYRDDICLDGLWQFQPVSLPAGFKEGYDAAPALAPVNAAGWDNTPIRIPSPWNVNSFADRNGLGGDFRCYPSYPAAWENIKMGWLRKKFRMPAAWKGRHIQLHFEALAGDAEIIVNGKAAGKHFGIFLPFDIDITGLAEPGKENELCVGIRKASLFDHRGDYGRRTYQAGSFWGQHIAGIWQDVFVQALPDIRIVNSFIKPRVDAGVLEAEVTVVNDKNTDVTLSLDAIVSPWAIKGDTDPTLQIPAQLVKVPAHGETKIVLSAPVKGRLKYWSTDTPYLYNLTAKLQQNGKSIDVKYTRFGWRQVSLQGNKVLLNGKAITLRGDSWHFLGIPQMSRRYAEAWYQAMRDAKLNAVRLHAQPYPSFYLDVADEMGILVLDETAMWASDGGPKLDDPLYWQDSRQHLSELILRDRNHPCVFGWSVSNEIMPIVRGVMRNPPGMKDTLVKHYGLWADICRKLDPTREWISADGEDDGEGHLPVYIVHYGGVDAMNRAQKNGKPWGVGEAGNAYYGTPEQVSETNGMRAYESFEGRMEGVAASSYQSLIAQRDRNAVYQSVFNMVWYGLRPLPLGMKDTSRPPTVEDGVYFTNFEEGRPGVQPERLGPYCTTLNPGYDPSLPRYRTWPLFDAIRDAAAGQPVVEKWMVPKPAPAIPPVVSPASSVQMLSGRGGSLESELERTGVLFDKRDAGKMPAVLFIDGANPPAANNRVMIENLVANGGTVVVWGVQPGSLAALNDLLPTPLQLSPRKASSLVTGTPDVITSGITAADLYFSEMRPPEITTQALAGPLVKESSILLKACETDWLKWNKQPEYAKTAMVIRSELETQSSGVVLIMKKIGKGRLVITTLPAAPKLAKAEKAVRLILSNMGVPLGGSTGAGRPLLKSGEMGIDFSNAKKEGNTAYQDFWVLSPRSLDDLLIEPNIPVVNMELSAGSGVQVWLNDVMIMNSTRADKEKATANALKLHQGWNHFLIKVAGNGGLWPFAGKLTCNQPGFLGQLESTLEKP